MFRQSVGFIQPLSVASFEIARMFKHSHREALVVAVTFLLTIFVDLTTGIGAGVVLAFLLGPQEFLRGPKPHPQP